MTYIETVQTSLMGGTIHKCMQVFFRTRAAMHLHVEEAAASQGGPAHTTHSMAQASLFNATALCITDHLATATPDQAKRAESRVRERDRCADWLEHQKFPGSVATPASSKARESQSDHFCEACQNGHVG